MNGNAVTADPDFSVSKAFQIMTNTKHSRLPVVDSNGRLLGLITEKLLAEVNPSKAISLNFYEINYLLSKTKVKDVMKTGIFKINKNRLIEEAAVIMKENQIGMLPVTDENEILAGVITRMDIFKAFIEMMGIKAKGTRLTIKTKHGSSDISDIVNIISVHNINILHISSFNNKSYTETVIKLETNKSDSVINELKNKGYEILSVISEN